MRRIASLLVGAVLLGPYLAKAQDDRPQAPSQEVLESHVERCFGEVYPVLFQTLREWNAERPRWQKEQYTALFEADLEANAAQKPAAWLRDRRQLWASLPRELQVELPIAASSQLILIGSYADNAAAFQERFSVKEQQQRLQAKLYLILALAQDSAMRTKERTIQASHVLLAMMRGYTGLWPLCPTVMPQLRDQEGSRQR